ncbi:MAG TPA: hypothetical protein VHE54_11215 [Puia sp.]|nr:hypothetical protein [Puia sp.]
MEPSINPGGASLQLILLVVFVLIAILFLMTEQNTLRTIRLENRQMPPGQVWLQLIPLFGQLWQFVVVTRIAGSLRNEIASWDADSILGTEAAAVAQENNRPTFGIGIAYCTLNVLVIALNATVRDVMPGIMAILALSEMACWISYWATLAGYKRKLRQKNLATL